MAITEVLFTVVVFIAVLVVLVIAHEIGHFVTAKASGVKVEEFGLGFPPRLASIMWHDTRYSINAVPLGGFVKMAGEVDPTGPLALASKSIPTRILVLGAGSLMNVLLPIVLLSVAFMVPHNIIVGEVQVQRVIDNSPAAKAGLAPGDVLLEINGKPLRNTGDLNRYIHLNLGQETTLLVKHDSTTRTVTVIPRWNPPPGQGATGIVVKALNPTTVREQLSFWKAIPTGFTELMETFVLFKNSIIGMFIGTAPVQVAGPVGIAQMTGEVARAGIGPLLEFAAFLSINLAIVNILPLPALDGGRIAFVLLEWVRRGKKISPKTEGLVHTIGFAMLLALILVVTYQDILRIVGGGG